MKLFKPGIRYIKTIYDIIHKHPYMASVILVILGITYLYLSSITVLQIEENGRNVDNRYQSRSAANSLHTFTSRIESKIPQSVLLNIAAKDEIIEISINNKPAPPLHEYIEGRTSYKNAKYGDIYKIRVKKGINLITIRSLNKDEIYSIAIGQQRSVFEYLLISLAFIIPLCLAALKSLEFLVISRT